MNPWELPYDESGTAQQTAINPWEVKYASQTTPGIAQQIGNNIGATQQEATASGTRLASGQQGFPESIAQGLSQGIGIVDDVASPVIGAGLKAAYDALTTQGFKDRQKLGLESVANSDIGQTVGKAGQNLQHGWNNYEQQDPAGAADLKALGTALTMGLPGKFTPNATNAAVDIAGNAIKNVATDTAMYAPRGVGATVKGVLAKSPEGRQAIEDSLKNAASNTYNTLDEKNIALNAGGAQKIFDGIKQDLKSGNINGLSSAVHPNTASTIDELGKWINSPAGTPAPIPEGGVNTAVGAVKTSGVGQISLKELDGYRRQLAGASYSNPEDVRAAAIVRGAIDDSIHPDTSKITAHDLTKGAPEDIGLLKKAQNEWATKSRYEAINAILDKADGDPNKIKSGLTKFLEKDKNTIGWPENELVALKKAASGSTMEKIYKMGGKFGLDLGTSTTLGNTIGPAIAAVASGGIGSGAAVVGGGTVLRQLQKYMARGKAEQLLSTIQKGEIPKEIYSLPPSVAKDILSQIKEAKQ